MAIADKGVERVGGRLAWLPGVLLTISILAAAPSASAQELDAQPVAQSTAPSITIEPYAFTLRDGTVLAAERGTFEVPEHRADPSSRLIRIGFVRFRSTGPRPGPPIVYLAGGPGGSGIEAAQGPRQPIFLALRELGDVIALDQRGVGVSNSVPPCKADAALDPAGGLNERALTEYYRNTLAKCVAEWRAAGVAVEGYTTPENADDLEDLRRALGAPKLRLWAISYGTHLALEMMRRHPGSIERVAMASVEGMDQTVKLPAHVDAALSRLVRWSSEASSPGNLIATMRRVHARLDAEPQVMTLEDASGQVSFSMDSFALRTLIGGIAKNPAGAAQLAAALRRLRRRPGSSDRAAAVWSVLQGATDHERNARADGPCLRDQRRTVGSVSARQHSMPSSAPRPTFPCLNSAEPCRIWILATLTEGRCARPFRRSCSAAIWTFARRSKSRRLQPADLLN